MEELLQEVPHLPLRWLFAFGPVVFVAEKCMQLFVQPVLVAIPMGLGG